MKTKMILFLVIMLMVFLPACSSKPIPTITPTPSVTPSPTPVPFDQYGQTLEDVPYCTMDGLPQKMDVYFPEEGGPWPAVIYVHGGSWLEGDKAEAADLGAGLNAQGYLVAALNYRLYPDVKFPAMIQDLKCAIRSLRARAAEYNLDPERIAALGASAGGHLVALLGTSDESAGWDVGEYLDQSSRLQAVIDVSGPSDLTQKFNNGEIQTMVLIAFGRDQMVSGSPVTYVTADDPPFLIIHGDDDGVIPVEQAYILNDKLVATGVPVQLVIVHNGDHSLGSIDGSATPTLAEIWQMELDFLEAHLK